MYATLGLITVIAAGVEFREPALPDAVAGILHPVLVHLLELHLRIRQ
jgi:hypothetical protein